MSSAQRVRRLVVIRGIVQGVGFRPFAFGLATELGLSGSIRNVGHGVEVVIEGTIGAVEAFIGRVRTDAPPLASIRTLDVTTLAPDDTDAAFTILASAETSNALTPVSPDVATCDDCLAEIRTPGDRRFGYPFTNCTNCGPRFTIVCDVPYDRPKTTMATFVMCEACEREYRDPRDRRFHAQPNACPRCGPSLTVTATGATSTPVHGADAIAAARGAIADGRILAVKGIGGFHLACDATNEDAVRLMRGRKGRGDKPFACMARSIDVVRRYADVSGEMADQLSDRSRPIVLLPRRDGEPSLAASVAPGQSMLGFMLPYAPLHDLLLDDVPWVMTSGNRSEEPIARTNGEALERLATIADLFVLHDRDIRVACDDSVVRGHPSGPIPIRRSRGFVPRPLPLVRDVPPVLAVGGELKATCCVTRDSSAILSQHIGDLANVETLGALERAVDHLCTLFRVEPRAVVCDRHPGYVSTRWATDRARREGVPLVEVQHHHAHAASLMAEHRLAGDHPIVAVTFDGTGYGTDGGIWGGEILVADYAGFERAAHLAPIQLAGGDAAIRHPARIALAHLLAAGIPWDDDIAAVRATAPDDRRVLARQYETRFKTFETTSMGRLFDAVASLLGVCHVASFEGQAAMQLEALAGRGHEGSGAFACAFGIRDGSPLVLDPAPVLRSLITGVRDGVPAAVLAAAFHRAVASATCEACDHIVRRRRLGEVGLTGGVFQNALLLDETTVALTRTGVRVLVHRLVPPNDGGLSLGQAAVATLGRADR